MDYAETLKLPIRITDDGVWLGDIELPIHECDPIQIDKWKSYKRVRLSLLTKTVDAQVSTSRATVIIAGVDGE